MRGGRGYSSRGGSFRGNRGFSGGRGSRDRYSSSSFDNSYDKGRFSDRYPRDDYKQSYRMDSYSRDRHSPERKRPRQEGRSRHEYSGGGTSYESSYSSDRRSYGGERERHFSSPRKEEFRRPAPSPAPRGGGGRGRLSTRGVRGLRRERGGSLGSAPRGRRLAERSYVIKRRGGALRSRGDFRRSTRAMRFRSSMVRRNRAMLSSDDSDDNDEEEEETEKDAKKEDGEEETKEVKAEAEEAAEGDVEMKEVKTEEGAEAAEKPKEKKKEKAGAKQRTFIKLVCPQCNIKVPTFRLYENHLESNTHLFAMRKVAAKQRSILAQMRQAQRNAQNELEKSGEGITDHTVFCPVCKLNYKQERAVHYATAAHKNLKKFLLPKCKVCKYDFKSPMVYEHHLCSVEHLKKKAKVEKAGAANEEDNLDEFTTIDSVGEVGDENAGSSEEKDKEEKKKKKKRVSVGIEQIKRVEAYYCDLCRMFLPMGTDNEYPEIIAGHCRKRFHMARYVRFKESDALKKRAEKLQRKETEEKEKQAKEGGEEGAEDKKMKEEEEEEGGEEEGKEMDTSKSADDDKLWDAVDKDLGELLEETDGRDDDDDEERANGERYDRFKSANVNGEDADASGQAEGEPQQNAEAKN